MAEVTIPDGYSEGKRRLPTWMLEPRGCEEPGNSGRAAKRKVRVAAESKNHVDKSAVKTITGNSESSIITIPHKPGSLKSKEIRSAKNSRREECLNNVASSYDIMSKKSRKKAVHLARDELEEKSTNNGNPRGKRCRKVYKDALELTVEDLQNIARKFVDADAKQRVPKIFPLNSSNTFNDKYDSGSKNLICSVGLSLKRCNSNSGSPSLGTCTTGDTNQDMLDLFLGPLLKQSSATRTDPEPPKTDDVIIDKQVHGEASTPTFFSNGGAHFEKSSLKDKVSMFLD